LRGGRSMAVAEAFAIPPEPARGIGVQTIGMTKIFGSFAALEDVSINVRPGSFHALLGENGAGKSTLVKCILGFYEPTRGAGSRPPR